MFDESVDVILDFLSIKGFFLPDKDRYEAIKIPTGEVVVFVVSKNDIKFGFPIHYTQPEPIVICTAHFFLKQEVSHLVFANINKKYATTELLYMEDFPPQNKLRYIFKFRCMTRLWMDITHNDKPLDVLANEILNEVVLGGICLG